jgi:hypothetical protein
MEFGFQWFGFWQKIRIRWAIGEAKPGLLPKRMAGFRSGDLKNSRTNV